MVCGRYLSILVGRGQVPQTWMSFVHVFLYKALTLQAINSRIIIHLFSRRPSVPTDKDNYEETCVFNVCIDFVYNLASKGRQGGY